jgi:amino acid adenylation domain-containing protein
MGQDASPASAGVGDERRVRLEAAIVGIWRDVLDAEQFGPSDDFFELGGDSLAAVRMLAAIEDLLLAPVSFTDFIDAPTIASLAAAVQAAREQPAQAAPPPRTNGHQPEAEVDTTRESEQDDRAPASYAQERLWFLQELEGATNSYNMPIGARLRGPIDAAALERSLEEIARRHAALRTTFVSDGGSAIAVQSPDANVTLERADVRGEPDPEAAAEELVDELTSTPLDLEHGPLMRALLVQVADGEHILELVFHHIICDGWSHVIVLRELGALYRAYAGGEAIELPEPRIQYPAYARQQREHMRDQALDDAVAPWLERLAGAPAALDLPTDHPRPPIPTYRGATYRVPLGAETAEAVRQFARVTRATPFATMLAAFYALLYRYSGQEDIVVGVTTSGRERTELADSVGLFASTVALRGDVSGAPGFTALVQRTREVVMWALAHEAAPFEQIVARLGQERDLSRHPVFQVFCAHVPHAPLDLEGAEPYDARPRTSRFDLTLFVEEERDDALEVAWEYSTDLFDPVTIERLASHYVRLLEAALSDPEMPIDELPLLAPDERRRAEAQGVLSSELVVSPEAAQQPVSCMHRRFEEHAAADPTAIALTYEGQTLTYNALNRRANQLAEHLRNLGAGPETMVALFLEPSPELIVAVLGVLKAGAAYVPLDPEYPSDRIAFVLEDTAAPLLVTEAPLLDRLPSHAGQTVCLDRDRETLDALGEENPSVEVTPENLAYVIYTSGSTGKPKGVQIEHRQISRLFTATESWFGFGPSDTWVLLHSYAFDFSVWEIWGALAQGGRLVISPLWTTRSPAALSELLVQERVTVMNATPSLFVVAQDELLRAADELALRFVVFGGEALAPAALRPWFAHFGDDGPTLVNMYGITETTVHVTYRPLRAEDSEREVSPIGIPIPDLTLHLLDLKGVPVPLGVAGELFVGGAGVARGYLNRPELNSERFIANPFGPGRLYRSGDVARLMANGELDFRGRIDDQVKIRGFRIELGEIQAAIREVDGVTDAAVIASEASPGDMRLAAYVVPGGGAAADEDSLRRNVIDALEHTLPAYMVPASITMLDRLPLTRNGKTDRAALPAPNWELRAESGFRAPRTLTEERIAEIWSSVLGIDQVGSEDNFFNLGGHSLLGARVATQVRESFEIDLSVRALFEQPTLSEFAAHIDGVCARDEGRPAGARDEGRPAGEQPSRTPGQTFESDPAQELPLSFQQQSLLFFDTLEPDNAIYNAALAVTVSGELDPAALQEALVEVFRRHEALRTVLFWDQSSARQTPLESFDFELPTVDLSGLPAAERQTEIGQRLRQVALQPFDLSRDLMLRAVLFRLEPTEHVLLFAPHHVAFDAWAVEVLYRDLSELYRASRDRSSPDLPALPMQYRDFARRQRERLQGGRLERELDFWRAQLAGAPTELRLPTDMRRPPLQTFAGATHTVELGPELTGEVRRLCQSEQVTPYMLLLAAFATLLYRRSGQDDILLGGPMANRDDPDLEHLIGFFANTIVVRVRLAGNPRFRDLLSGVRESVLESYEHQEVPLELVVDAVRPVRDPSRNPLFQVNFRVRIGSPPVLDLAPARTHSVPVDLGLARFDLALELHLLDDRLTAEFNYNTALFRPETIEGLAADFEALLREGLTDPERRLLSLSLAENGATASDESPAPRPSGIRRFRETSTGR